MSVFLSNVAASIVAGILLVVGTAFFSRKAKRVLTGILFHLLEIDIESVYENKTYVQSELKAELKKSRDISILTGRGNELNRDTFSHLFTPSTRGKIRIRILLPETNLKAGEYDWIKQREKEVAEFDPAFGKGLLLEQIEVNARFLEKHLPSGNVELRRFNYPHIGRIIITEKFAYFTPYHPYEHGRESRVYKFRRGGEMYENYKRLFEQLWTACQPETDNDVSGTEKEQI